MNPDIKNDNFDDELPKPAKPSVELEKPIKEMPDINLDDVDLTKINTDLPTPIITKEPVKEEPISPQQEIPETSGAAVFGFDDIKEMDAAELLSTNPIPKVTINDELPTPTLPVETEEMANEFFEPKKKPSGFITFIVVLIVVAAAGFGIYKLLEVNNKDIKTNTKEPTTEQPIKNNVDDTLVYADKIIKEKLNQVMIHEDNREAMFLYINPESFLSIIIGNKNLVVNEETKGHIIGNLSNQKVKNLYQSSGCTLKDKETFVLMENGQLFYVDLNRDYTELYEKVKELEEGQGTEINLINAPIGVKVQDFTTIVDGKDECKIYNPYMLVGNTKPEIRKLKKVNETITLGDRYIGHVNYIGIEGIDYLVYPDKTISCNNNKVLTETNGQNHKFEKVIYGRGEITELKATYVFISTDNKLYYMTKEDLYNPKTNNKEVLEVVNLPANAEGNASNNQVVLIKYADETTATLSIPEQDLSFFNIQSLIDEPIN